MGLGCHHIIGKHIAHSRIHEEVFHAVVFRIFAVVNLLALMISNGDFNTAEVSQEGRHKDGLVRSAVAVGREGDLFFIEDGIGLRRVGLRT